MGFMIDEKENAIDSLEKAATFAEQIRTEEYAWKWFVIAWHHAVYHFMLLTLLNSDGSGVWKEPLSKKMSDAKWLGENNQLISLSTAYKWIQLPERTGGYIGSHAFTGTVRHESAVTRLNDVLRNQLVHYKPLGWLVTDGYFEEVIPPTVEIVRYAAIESPRKGYSEDQAARIVSSLARVEKIFAGARQ